MHQRFRIFLILFILADTIYSAYQHFHVPLDGDMAPIILPAEWYQQVLQDPFGFTVLTEGKRYGGTNRFFAHWSLSEYYKTVPHWLQYFVSPLNSVYLAGALVKTAVQLLLIWLLAVYITLAGKFPARQVLPAAASMVPFFHTMGYNKYMGIIDQSVTYTFFYALPLALLLLFFLPFFKGIQTGNFRFTIPQYGLLALLALVLPFQGPLIPALVLLVCPAVVLFLGWHSYSRASAATFGSRIKTALRSIPKPLLFYFLLIGFFSLYSLYLGFFNAENPASAISVAERYQRLLPGLFVQLSRKLGYPLLLAFLVVNVVLLHKHGGKGRPILVLLKWLLVLAILYLLLLPLGGYRIYRPLIIRRDTFLPVTLGLFFSFGLTAMYLLQQPFKKAGKVYKIAFGALLVLFTLADQPDFGFYNCERQALEKIAASGETIVKLEGACKVMAWEVIREPKASELNAHLLHYWGITSEPKRYFFGE